MRVAHNGNCSRPKNGKRLSLGKGAAVVAEKGGLIAPAPEYGGAATHPILFCTGICNTTGMGFATRRHALVCDTSVLAKPSDLFVLGWDGMCRRRLAARVQRRPLGWSEVP